MMNILMFEEQQLAELMSELSEKCYSAGWMVNLEYILWDAVISGPRSYGNGKINSLDIRKLTQVSRKTNSWIMVDENLEEVAIQLDKWEIKFAEDIKRNPKLLRG